jgi:lysophospholipase L1-like esterase
MPKLRSILVKFCLFTVIFVGGMELSLRLLGYASGPCQYYDPDIGYRFYPNQERFLLGSKGERTVKIVTNEMGYRGPWYLSPRPEGVKRIACLGDSYTFGWGVEDDESYPIYLEGLLAEQARLQQRAPTEVFNLGVPGYNTRNELNTYLHNARPLQADLVVLAYYVNDLEPDNGGPQYTDSFLFQLFGKTAIADGFHKHLRSKIPIFSPGRTPELKAKVKHYKAHSNEIQDDPRAPASRPFLDESMAALHELLAAVREDGAEFLLVAYPSPLQIKKAVKMLDQVDAKGSFPEGAFKLQDELRAQAEQLGVPYLDLMAPFARSKEKTYGKLSVGHPNAHGYTIGARQIARRISELGLL